MGSGSFIAAGKINLGDCPDLSSLLVRNCRTHRVTLCHAAVLILQWTKLHLTFPISKPYYISKSPISPQRLKFQYFLTVVYSTHRAHRCTASYGVRLHSNVQCRQSSQFTQCKWLDFESSGVVVPPKDMTLCSITSKTSIQHRSRMFQVQNRIHSWQQATYHQCLWY
jgi:hypothetical protein